MATFRDIYLPAGGTYRVLDIGSKEYLEQDSYRSLFEDARFDYVGLDLEPGQNVDIVPNDAYNWTELETSSFDSVVSGQVFEHNPFFWITMAEIARVLRPDGLVCIIAPSSGPAHRYPYDCWRFYPDAAPAMFAFVGLELVESYIEAAGRNKVVSTQWADMFTVGRKPATIDLERLERIVALRPSTPLDPDWTGKRAAIDAYEEAVRVSDREWYQHRLKMALRPAVPNSAIKVIRKIESRVRR